VDFASGARRLRMARVAAVVRAGNEIVGVGAILSVSAAVIESTPTCEPSQPQTSTCRRQLAPGPSEVICFIGYMSSRLTFLPFENEERTSLCWWNTLSIATLERRASTLQSGS
jgi:hypothetical protein